MLRIYRWLLRLYPAAFHDEYAGPMERAFRDELAEAPNVFAMVWLWMRLLFDLAISAPSQIAKETWRDSKHALRLWAKRPWQTGFAVFALAVAIGANTGVFSMVNALLLRSLPFRDPDRLVLLRTAMLPHDSGAQFDQWRQSSKYLEDAALSAQKDANLGDSDHMIRIHAAQTSWNFFSLLGVRPHIGREFLPGDTDDVLISYGLWQELYGGSERALGKAVFLDGQPLRIVGVMPPDFDYPNKSVAWKSATLTRGNNGWDTIGRLKRGISWPEARGEYEAEVAARSPVHRKESPMRGWQAGMFPLRDALAGPVKTASLLLLSAVLLILLIACANLANLMLARTADRQQEFSVRSALGASRARLTQQLMTECLLLAFLSAGFGVIVALGATSVLAKAEPGPLHSQTYSILDGRVLVFMLTISIVSALFVGLLPALTIGRTHFFAARGSIGLRGSRLVREVLVTAQIVLTVVLLTSSVSVGRAFSHLMQMDRGFKVDGVVTASVSLDGTRHTPPVARLAYFNEVVDRLRHLPGVRTASATDFLPLYSKAFIGGPFSLDGHPSPPGTGTDLVPIMSDYFATMGGQLLYGREFTDAEVQNDANIAIVNDVFAKMFLGTTDAVGHLETIGDRPRKIIGVVKRIDFMERYLINFGDIDPPETFIPAHSPGHFDSTFVVHVSGRPEDHLTIIRQAVQLVDRGVPVFSVESMQQRLDEAFARPKFYRTALIFFASFALLLAVLGIYAVVSYAVTQRTHEMGVRLALGTTSARLRTMLLGQGLVSVLCGTLGGVLAAVLAGRLLESLVEGASALSPATYFLAVPSICLIAALSIWTATRRITGLDVMEILRAE
ncbi:MAG: ADOP family duplicated permease [Bryobacteraceae bacterium]